MLLQDDRFSNVRVLLRTPTLTPRPGLEPIIVDFSDDESLSPALKGDVIFCCIGTTIRQAGSQEKFREVDFNIPVRCATIARRQGMAQFLLMSSIGASTTSRSFYMRTKGETENAVMALGYPGYHIFRPSMLVGVRKEFRLGEWFGYLLAGIFYFLLQGRWKKYRPIKAGNVALAMIHAAVNTPSGAHIYESDKIKEMADLEKERLKQYPHQE
jgi:uncharacterized protein YbjT (DUF2867 family)